MRSPTARYSRPRTACQIILRRYPGQVTPICRRSLRPRRPTFGTSLSSRTPGRAITSTLQHGDHVVLYAHMQNGSLNPALLNPGTPVKRGQFLGLAGNAGNSTGPHLHFHAIKGTKPETGPLRPFPFRDTWVVESSAIKPPNPTGPWVKAADQGLPGRQRPGLASRDETELVSARVGRDNSHRYREHSLSSRVRQGDQVRLPDGVGGWVQCWW